MHYSIKLPPGGLGNKFLSLIGVLGDLNALHGDAFSHSVCDEQLWMICRRCSTRLLTNSLTGSQLGMALYSGNSIILSNYFITVKPRVSSPILGVHFRGSDFAAWKPHSIMSASYFIDNIERSGFKTLRLCTDDSRHPVFLQLRDWLLANGYEVYSSVPSVLGDLYLLAQCTQIVASPSTFSLSGALLGGGKIIFPKKFAEIEAAQRSEFWRCVLEGVSSEYVDITLS